MSHHALTKEQRRKESMDALVREYRDLNERAERMEESLGRFAEDLRIVASMANDNENRHKCAGLAFKLTMSLIAAATSLNPVKRYKARKALRRML